MSKELQDLFDEIKRRDSNVSKFSKETGIPVDRIYQWKKGNGKPKAEDAEIIKKWLNGAEQITGSCSKKDMEQDAIIDLLLLEVAKLRSKIYGISVNDSIDELERNAEIALRQIEKGV